MSEKQKMHPGFSRNAKVIGAIIVLAIAGAGIVLYAARQNKQNDIQPTTLPPMTAVGGKATPESQRYADTLNSANKEGLSEAKSTNGTFVPSLSDRNAEIDAALNARSNQNPVAAQPQKVDYQAQSGQGGQQAPMAPQPAQALGQQVSALVAQWTTSPGQEILGIQKEKSMNSASQPAATTTTNVASTVPSTKTAIIKANAKYYGHMQNAINTDTHSDSLVMLDQGPCKGGELRGVGKLSGGAVTASYNVLTCGGQTYSVEAVALDPDTLSNALPADIDHHVVAHLVVPALLGAVGAAGQVYQNAGATVTNNPLGGTTIVESTNPTGRQLLGAAAAGATSGASNVIQKAEGTIPAITGTVAQNQNVVILFKSDVVAKN